MENKKQQLEDRIEIALEVKAREPNSEDTINSKFRRYILALESGCTWHQFLKESGIEDEKELRVNMITFTYDSGEGALFSTVYDTMYVPMDWKITRKLNGCGGIYGLEFISKNPRETLNNADNILRRYASEVIE